MMLSCLGLVGSLLAAVVAMWLSGLLSSTFPIALLVTSSNRRCTQDPTIPIRSILIDANANSNANDDHLQPCDFFSETYQQARERFRQACWEHPTAELHSLPILPAEDLTTDICVLQGTTTTTTTSKKLVIHSSGLHGVEGFAGSAIQVAYLQALHRKHYMQNTTSDAALPSVLLIHAINPHGMAHNRRWNEHNVDLNRNALHPDQWKAVSLEERDPNVAGYLDFDEVLFHPRRAPTNYDLYVGFWLRAISSIYQHSLLALKRGMVAGQYHDDQGIFYGGTHLEPSLQKLSTFLKRQVLPLIIVDKNTTTTTTLTWVDVHTGLGKSGRDTLLLVRNATPQELAAVYPESQIPGLHKDGSDVQDGYDLTLGMLGPFVLRLLNKEHVTTNTTTTTSNPPPPWWFVTQEFGTIPSVFVGRSLILERMAHHYLPPEEALEWTSLTRRAFYVETKAWRRSVLTRGLRVLQQSLRNR